MKILEVRDTAEGKKILAELTENESMLIQRAVTAPVKRTVNKMSVELGRLILELDRAKEFNDEFIRTFYHPFNKKKAVKNGGKKK
jgi:hypothetical protein